MHLPSSDPNRSRSAAARAGKGVLHVDAAPTYGTHWAALHLDEFVAWATALQARGSDAAANGHVPNAEQQSDGAARCIRIRDCASCSLCVFVVV